MFAAIRPMLYNGQKAIHIFKSIKPSKVMFSVDAVRKKLYFKRHI